MKKILIYILAILTINSSFIAKKSFAYSDTKNDTNIIRIDLTEKNFFNVDKKIENQEITKKQIDCDSYNGKLWGTSIGLLSGISFGFIYEKAILPKFSGGTSSGAFVPLTLVYGFIFTLLALPIGIFIDENNNSECKKNKSAN